MIPEKIISGGQTGADQGALDFAIANGITHGGWCPRGRTSDEGPIPSRYQLAETDSWRYNVRTEANVRDSDFTVIFNAGQTLSKGCALTLNCCKRLKKPFLILRSQTNDTDEREAKLLARALLEYQPRVLNVAGNREGTTPGMSQHVQAMLKRAWFFMSCREVADHMERERRAQSVGPTQTTFLGI